MKRILSYALAVLFLAFTSCRTPREDVVYFQDIIPYYDTVAEVEQHKDILVQPKDELQILVSSQDPRLTNQFNLPILTNQIGVENNSTISRGVSGYLVNSEGNIDFPVLGLIHVAGLTREQVAQKIKGLLQEDDLVKDAVVTVKFMNLGLTVMGEVSKPGRYLIDRDNMTIIDAINQAGDLTIYGRRDNVLVIRTIDGQRRAYSIDLGNSKSIFNSPVYHVQQNDLIYVEPNDTRVRQSTVNGNNLRSTSFWISIGSLLTSFALLITNVVK